MKISNAAGSRSFPQRLLRPTCYGPQRRPGRAYREPEGRIHQAPRRVDRAVGEGDRPRADGAWDFGALSDAWARMADYSNALRDGLTARRASCPPRRWPCTVCKNKSPRRLHCQGQGHRSLHAGANRRGQEHAAGNPGDAEKLAGNLRPAGPPDSILGLPSKDYEPRLTAAREQVGKLNAKGLKLGGKGSAWVTSMAWLGATEFNGQHARPWTTSSARCCARETCGDPSLGVRRPAPTPRNRPSRWRSG